jgi:hypothetical protein
VWLCSSIRSFVLHVVLCGEECRHVDMIFNHFVLLSFITNPLLNSASLSCVTTSSTASTSSAYNCILSQSVKNHSMRISLDIPDPFLQYYVNNIADSALVPCLEYLPASNASVNCLCVVTFWTLLHMEILRTIKERSPVTR